MVLREWPNVLHKTPYNETQIPFSLLVPLRLNERTCVVIHSVLINETELLVNEQEVQSLGIKWLKQTKRQQRWTAIGEI